MACVNHAAGTEMGWDGVELVDDSPFSSPDVRQRVQSPQQIKRQVAGSAGIVTSFLASSSLVCSDSDDECAEDDAESLSSGDADGGLDARMAEAAAAAAAGAAGGPAECGVTQAFANLQVGGTRRRSAPAAAASSVGHAALTLGLPLVHERATSAMGHTVVCEVFMLDQRLGAAPAAGAPANVLRMAELLDGWSFNPSFRQCVVLPRHVRRVLLSRSHREQTFALFRDADLPGHIWTALSPLAHFLSCGVVHHHLHAGTLLTLWERLWTEAQAQVLAPTPALQLPLDFVPWMDQLMGGGGGGGGGGL